MDFWQIHCMSTVSPDDSPNPPTNWTRFILCGSGVCWLCAPTDQRWCSLCQRWQHHLLHWQSWRKCTKAAVDVTNGSLELEMKPVIELHINYTHHTHIAGYYATIKIALFIVTLSYLECVSHNPFNAENQTTVIMIPAYWKFKSQEHSGCRACFQFIIRFYRGAINAPRCFFLSRKKKWWMLKFLGINDVPGNFAAIARSPRLKGERFWYKSIINAMRLANCVRETTQKPPKVVQCLHSFPFSAVQTNES